ncbi:hypothetical protein Salat_2529800 [Sesamum alatum]|uniref:Uncharacterized protein n=1 Tax=Sesamum alatum TaxID=300844 RepID=A0AAE1XT30_9LAMI|nr:hypothetical protein Salat_2529800 [Sesamum alatum]
MRVERLRSLLLLANRASLKSGSGSTSTAAKSKAQASPSCIRASVARSELHAAKEAAEEEENTKHLKELVAWWKQAREELKTPSSKVAKMEGEMLDPNWAISARSSVLQTHIRELQQNYTHAQAKEMEALEAKIALDARVAVLEAQLASTIEENKKIVVDALERDRADGFSTGHLAGKTEGLNEGCEAYLQSEEFKNSISETRLQGARDFLKAPAFKMIVDIRFARYLNEGFDKCISECCEVPGPDEFKTLLADVGNLP